MYATRAITIIITSYLDYNFPNSFIKLVMNIMLGPTEY